MTAWVLCVMLFGKPYPAPDSPYFDSRAACEASISGYAALHPREPWLGCKRWRNGGFG